MGVKNEDKCGKREETAEDKLKGLSNIGKSVRFTEKGDRERSEFKGEVIDEVSTILPNGDKHFIQKIKYKEDDRAKYAYRFCYYTLDKDGGKVVFGQFASTVPANNFLKLIKSAEGKGFGR